ncbi:hypothetical protein ACFC3F_11525 [Microbacterium sp. NPDC055910]|uniref:hypothetical protein n=1 Tax=Microbacterium sp. NPDC055910 TaxID=3345659 RepID=UPI0035DCDED8
MDLTPKRRVIEVLTGDADGIEARGKDVKSLGDQMIGSAGVLEAIAGGADGQEGLSIEKIREVVGDIHQELRLAGERYTPTGDALVVYAIQLRASQQSISTAVTNCTASWSTLQAKEQELSRLDPFPGLLPLPMPEDPTPEQLQRQEDIASARTAVGCARNAFVTDAQAFDTEYDTWEAAFDQAADSIGDATEGGISDAWHDNIAAAVDGILVVLQWAGVVLAVLAFVVGGPIIALLGTLVALATLAATIFKAARGTATGWDLALAIIGVIPFGSIAKFANGKAGVVAFLDDMIGGWGTSAGRTAIGTAFRNIGTGWSSASGFFPRLTSAFGGANAIDDIAARLMGFGDAAEALFATGKGGGWGIAGTVFGHYGWVINTPAGIVLQGVDVVQQSQARTDGRRHADNIETWETELVDA